MNAALLSKMTFFGRIFFTQCTFWCALYPSLGWFWIDVTPMIEDASVAIQEGFFFFFAENQFMVLFCLEIDYGWERFFLLHTNSANVPTGVFSCVVTHEQFECFAERNQRIGWVSNSFFCFFWNRASNCEWLQTLAEWFHNVFEKWSWCLSKTTSGALL